MRHRVALIFLLGLCLAISIGWLLTASRDHAQLAALTTPPTAVDTRTNVFVRREFFSWNEIESPDYPTYIANLRGIGCPEPTIRDIIVADVNGLYARKLADAIRAVSQHWWSAQADRVAIEKARADNELERRALLAHLLGTNWNAGATEAVQSNNPIPLNGPILGNLPDATKQAVRDIVAAAKQKALAEGLSNIARTNSAAMVQYENDLWTKLAGVLSPDQLEAFKLQYSPNAAALRQQLDNLQYFNVTPAEFQSVFTATENIDDQIRALGNASDPASQQQLQSLEQQREAAIKNALGPDRYASYVQLQDPAFQAAVATVQAEGGTAADIQLLYKINQATAQEEQQLQTDPTMTDLQKNIALQKIQLDQLEAQAQALGQSIPAEAAPAPPAPIPLPTIAHTTVPGETVQSVAQLYGVSQSVLEQANPNIDFSKPLPNQTTLNVPFQPLPAPFTPLPKPTSPYQ